MDYVSKAVTTSITATSRASVKVKDCYYTVEFSEERSLPQDCDVEKERAILWDVVNTEVDNQVQDIVNMFK